MGGTTAKICLIRDHTPKTARVFEVARSYRFKKGSGMPISIPVIDMVEIGAGGGSLAHVDGMRQIRVGPESAGSEPGPASYGRGGTRPAVTDADLILGKLDPEGFAGGAITLSPDAATAALETDVGDPLGMSATEAAWGVAEVVDETMANAARVHAVENGEDLSDYTMIAFGGAAPLHAARLCEKLGIGRCLVPRGAGVGSAIGFLKAPFSFEANQSVFMRLSAFEPETVRALFREMGEEAAHFVRSCDPKAEILTAARVYMRYAGQGWEIPVDLSPDMTVAPDPAAILALFERDYAALFGRAVEGLDTEVTVWSVNAYTRAAETPQITPVDETSVAAPAGQRSLTDQENGSLISATRYERAALTPGAEAAGPALITEAETTLVVPPTRSVHVLADGTLDMQRQDGGTRDV